MRQVILAAMGGGELSTMTGECKSAIENADTIVGAERLLAGLPDSIRGTRVAAVRAADVRDALLAGGEHAVAIYSGDTGFYSGVRSVLPLLQEAGVDAVVLPGVSSVQLMSARLGRPWQEWNLVSAHGVDCSAVAAVMKGKPAFFLTGGALGPKELCQELTDAGLGALSVTVAERLSYPDERIVTAAAEEISAMAWSPLSVMLAEAAPRFATRTAGLPDSGFIRGDVPMTKQEVRAAALAALGVRPTDTVWDLGAGTGSVSVELALAACEGRAYAVECVPEACRLIEQNRAKFCAWNLAIIEGKAPDAIRDLPAPDAVFIGGTRGNMDAIVDVVLEKNPAARVCISAIALETVTAAMKSLAAHGLSVTVTQIAVSRTRPAGSLHLLMANNPIFLIAGGCYD
jgi:precorrin-6Y C5,15-methyltransferase (decarboxylating)